VGGARSRSAPLGAGDCEALRSGPLAQPTNTATSLAFVAAGCWLATRTTRVVPTRRRRVWAVATLIAATGVGSVAYHGPGGRLAHLAHDGTLALSLAWAPSGLQGDAPPTVQAAVRRRQRVAATAAAAGIVSYQLGRTGSATCRPMSRWQWHGLWHVAAAVAAAAWADATEVQPHLATLDRGV
jgi:hypothetical protein